MGVPNLFLAPDTIQPRYASVSDHMLFLMKEILSTGAGVLL